jgi:putative ABC transport system permease protein
VKEARWFRLPRIFRPNARAEAGDEIAFHIQMRTAELIEQGVSPALAREMAEARFGPVHPIEEALVDSVQRRRHRADRMEALMDVTKDLAFAFRSLRRAPAFTAAAVATLALGVGATLAVFTVVNGVLLRPLPYDDPARIHLIWISNRTADGEGGDLPLSSGFYSDIARESRSFESMAAFRAWSYSLSTAGSPDAEPLSGAKVSPDLFNVLGVRPQLGQPFTTGEAVPGAPNVAMISHELWQRRFGGDRSIVGKPVTLNGQSFTVTAVMPPGFAFPRGAELPAPFGFGLRTEVWTPLVFDSSDTRNYGTQNLSAVGRLPSADNQLAAQTELTGIMRRFLDENAPNLKLEYVVRSMASQSSLKVERALVILFGAVVLVLLIATANVASLLIARISARQRELAVRTALGAARSRIARQLVTEHLVLAVVGTTLGLVIAYWTTQVMLALVPGSMPRADDIGFDWRVLSFALGVALVAGVGFGLAATVASRSVNVAATLHDSDQRSAGSVRRRYGRRLLVAGEVALSLMLLIGAALLTRSFISLQRVQLGFDATSVVTAEIGVPVVGGFRPAIDGPNWDATLRGITTRVQQLQGVEAAGMVSALPLSGAFEAGGLRLPGVTYEPGQGPGAAYSVVTGDYFKAAGIRLVAGRTFDASDDDVNRSTIVINREVARALFGSETAAIGREIRATFEFLPSRPPRTVIGVVDVVKQLSVDEPVRSQVYVPQAQMPYPGLTLVVKASGDAARDPRSLLALVRREARAVNPSATIRDVRLMSDVVSNSMARQRFNMTLITVFAALALVLAIVGLYGVLALIVGQRRREIGVRLALGAQPWSVVRMILREGATMALVGVILGVAGAIGLTRLLETLLYGVGTTDMATFAGAVVVVSVVALGATYIPARRAAHVDPKTALVGD